MLRRLMLVLLALTGPCDALSQALQPGFAERFDSVSPPLLPAGWTSSRHRTGESDDFLTASTAPHSPPNAVTCTNATIEQWIQSPTVDCSKLVPETLSFFSRRSSSFKARVVVEASLDGGASFPVQLGEITPGNGETSYQRVLLTAPPAISGSIEVIFRWRVLPDSTGTAGTLRLDDIELRFSAANDLELRWLRIDPPMPSETDSILLQAMVYNDGQASAPSFSLEAYIDANHDSIAQAGELRSTSFPSSPLPAHDSLTLYMSLGSLPPGRNDVIGKLRFASDQNPTNDEQHLMLKIGWRRPSFVINEIMYAPGAGEPEWIELLNTRADTILPGRWAISDAATDSRHVVPSGAPAVLPHGFIVLTRDSAAFLEIHRGSSCRFIEVPGFPSLNNAGDIVVLFDDRALLHDSVSYLSSWGGSAGGVSLERIDEFAPSTGPDNWMPSRQFGGSTPGAANSVRRKDVDLAVVSLRGAASAVNAGDSVGLIARVTNRGRLSVSGISATFYRDADVDSLAEPSEVAGMVVVTDSVAPGDSLEVRMTIPGPTGGSHLYIVVVSCADEDTSNDIAYLRLTVRRSGRSLCINEVHYAPPAGVPEWVELLNISPEMLDLSRWSIGNRGPTRYLITQISRNVGPFDFVVLTKDTALMRSSYPVSEAALAQVSTLPTFCWNNGGDAVVVWDDAGTSVDSVWYRPSWGGTGGFSLERRDPAKPSSDSANWASCWDPLGATPGKANSRAIRDHDLRIAGCRSLTALVGTQLDVAIRNAGRLSSGSFRLLVYSDNDGDSTGSPAELVADAGIARPIPAGDSLSVSLPWPGAPCGLRKVIVLVDYPEDERASDNRAILVVAVECAERTLVINEIMYSPFAGEPEYLELYNPTQAEIDLSGWTLHDRPTGTGAVTGCTIADSACKVPPNGYVVLSADTGLAKRFPFLLHEGQYAFVVLPAGGLNLSNAGDDVVLTDPSFRVVDSVAYMPAWHNPEFTDVSGRSLERILALGGSCDGRNWSTCVLPAGGTPGQRNSIAASSSPKTSALSFSPNPFSPDGDGFEDFAVVHYELRIRTPLISVKVFDARGRLIRRLVNSEPSSGRGEIIWDGLDDQRRKARIGIYVVLVEAIDAAGGILETVKGALVVAGRL